MRTCATDGCTTPVPQRQEYCAPCRTTRAGYRFDPWPGLEAVLREQGGDIKVEDLSPSELALLNREGPRRRRTTLGMGDL